MNALLSPDVAAEARRHHGHLPRAAVLDAAVAVAPGLPHRPARHVPLAPQVSQLLRRPGLRQVMSQDLRRRYTSPKISQRSTMKTINLISNGRMTETNRFKFPLSNQEKGEQRTGSRQCKKNSDHYQNNPSLWIIYCTC